MLPRLFLISAAVLFAQDPLTIFGTGVRDPSIRRVARGQIITVFLRNATTIVPRAPTGSEYKVTAQTLPIPATLGGFAASFDYPALSVPAPIFSVSQRDTCGLISRKPECLVTAVTLQVPFELRFSGAQLVIREGSNRTASATLGLAEDRVHVVKSSDLASLDPADDQSRTPGHYVTHADGTLITAASPAKPGEVVVIYATGLGRTLPEVPSGTASPLPPTELNLSTSVINAPRRAIALQLDFHVNAGPARPYRDPARPITDYPVPEFLGLAPGQVGVYQINVRLPDRFPPVPHCMFESDAEAFGSVFSNLTIQIGAFDSIDGAQICVEPGTP